MAEHAGKTTSVLKSSSLLSPCLPMLVFHHRNQNNADEMLMFSVSRQSLHEDMDEQGLLASGNSMCWPTPQGWMLLAEAHDTSSPARLWNPLTGEEVPLPDIGEEHEIPHCCVCFLTHKDPAHPACAVALFHRAAPDIWYCHVTAGGGAAGWRHYAYDVGDYPLPPDAHRAPTKKVISMAASFQGKLYFINTPREMGAIDFSSPTKDPTFELFGVRLPVDSPPEMSSSRDSLLEWQGRLFLVSILFVGFDPDNIGAIQVYEMDFSSSLMPARWRRVHDIGDAVFFLEDGNMAASCKASGVGLDANRIYFMKNLLEDDADLCIFDLESNAYEVTRTHHHDDLLLCRKPFWIVPPS